MAVNPGFQKMIDGHWENIKKKRNKKINTIKTREDELAAMEAFIAKKGVTVCEPVEIPDNNQFTSQQQHRPAVSPAWRG
jgi:site-specific recombinase XerD